MAKKYYAIKKGKDCENIIVMSWSECLQYVKGVKGASYKSFTSEEEARMYLQTNSSLKKGIDKYPDDVPHIYVDGSYNINTGDFGYGLVILNDNIIVYAEYDSGHEEEDNQRQVNGELMAAIKGLKFSVDHGYDKVVIFYDYAGVCNHAMGTWERNTKLSKNYYDQFNLLKNEGNLDVVFVKVDSHTGDLYNDIADELAKTGAGLAFSSEVDKAILKEKLFVSNEECKDILSNIIKDNCDNVIVKNSKSLVENIDYTNYLEEIIEEISSLDESFRFDHITKMEESCKNQIISYFIKKYYD